MWVGSVPMKICSFVQRDVEVTEDDDVFVLSCEDVGSEVDLELLIIIPGSTINTEYRQLVSPTIHIKS